MSGSFRMFLTKSLGGVKLRFAEKLIKTEPLAMAPWGAMTRARVCLALVAMVGVAQGSVLTFQIEPRTMDCVYERLSQGETFKMEFEVTRGGLLDIKVKVFTPSGGAIIDKMVYFNQEDDRSVEESGRLSFVALHDGEHRICFDNSMSRWTAKVVSVLLPSASGSGADVQAMRGAADVAKLEHLGPVVDSVIKIADALDGVSRTQHHMAVRERSHQDTQLSTNSRVHWLAAFESCVLIGMSLFQLHYIRRWLDKVGPQRRRV